MKEGNIKLHCNTKAYSSTISTCAKQAFDGNILCVAGEYIVRFLQFMILILIWRGLSREGADLGGTDLNQLLTYTLMASILRRQLDIISPATSALWEGSIIGRYTRPMSIIGSLIAETIGKNWIMIFFCYSLPLWMLSPLLGINPLPVSFADGILAAASLLLSISLGFALDLLFASLAIRLKNGCWAVLHIRESIYALFSGALIPFAFFPWGVGKVFAYLPFGSIASAPLMIYTGMAEDPVLLILIQFFWNVILWVSAAIILKKSEERMISYGG